MGFTSSEQTRVGPKLYPRGVIEQGYTDNIPKVDQASSLEDPDGKRGVYYRVSPGLEMDLSLGKGLYLTPKAEADMKRFFDRSAGHYGNHLRAGAGVDLTWYRDESTEVGAGIDYIYSEQAAKTFLVNPDRSLTFSPYSQHFDEIRGRVYSSFMLGWGSLETALVGTGRYFRNDYLLGSESVRVRDSFNDLSLEGKAETKLSEGFKLSPSVKFGYRGYLNRRAFYKNGAILDSQEKNPLLKTLHSEGGITLAASQSLWESCSEMSLGLEKDLTTGAEDRVFGSLNQDFKAYTPIDKKLSFHLGAGLQLGRWINFHADPSSGNGKRRMTWGFLGKTGSSYQVTSKASLEIGYQFQRELRNWVFETQYSEHSAVAGLKVNL